MNRIVRLEKDGTLWRRDRLLADDGITCLGTGVELSPACTLRSFFLLLDRDASLQRLNPFIPSFLAQFGNSPKQGCVFPGIEVLELNRVIEMTGYPGSPSVRIFVTLDGRGPHGPRSIAAAGIDQLLDVPMRLGRLKHTVFGDRVDTLEFETVFNLFDIIDGVCWELSFHNLPDRCRMRNGI